MVLTTASAQKDNPVSALCIRLAQSTVACDTGTKSVWFFWWVSECGLLWQGGDTYNGAAKSDGKASGMGVTYEAWLVTYC